MQPISLLGTTTSMAPQNAHVRGALAYIHTVGGNLVVPSKFAGREGSGYIWCTCVPTYVGPDYVTSMQPATVVTTHGNATFINSSPGNGLLVGFAWRLRNAIVNFRPEASIGHKDLFLDQNNGNMIRYHMFLTDTRLFKIRMNKQVRSIR